MQDEYKRQYHEEPVNNVCRKQLLKNILPDDIRSFLETQTMLRDELSYETIKNCVNNLAQRVAKVPLPMDLSAFREAREQPQEEAPAPEVDSFGRGPVGGQKPGKGEGRGVGGGPATGKPETRDCHNCGKTGHICKILLVQA